jgi:MFS family permease
VALFVAVIAFAVQQTSIVPAIADVQKSLKASTEWASWLVTVYLMVATVATPAMGRLGDLFGRHRMLLIGLAVFAAASVGASLAPDLAVLIVFRAVQGIGGAVYPLALALARENVPEEQATRVIALLTGAFGIGTAIGFVGGGALAEYVSWRAIFATSAVLVAAALPGVWRVLDDAGERASGRYDGTGTALLAVASIALLAGLTLVVSFGWASPVTHGLLALALVAAVCWVGHERRTADPLIDIHVLADRRVTVANLATIGLGWALFGSYLLIPQFARSAGGGYGLAVGSAAIGLLMLPLAVGQIASGTAAGFLPRIPPRTRFAAGLVLIAGGNVVLALTRHSPGAVALGALLLGIGAGVALQSSSATATGDVEEDVAAVSAALNSTVRRLAGGISGQVNTILLASLIAARSGSATFTAYTTAYLMAAVLCLFGAAVLLVPADR